MFAWIVLVVSGLLEAVWATALGASHGFSRPLPSALFVVGLVLSMGGLAYATREIPTGTAYAVWVGIGAALTVGYAMATGSEPVSLVKVLLIVALVGCVVGLKLVGDAHSETAAGGSSQGATTIAPSMPAPADDEQAGPPISS